MREAVKQFIPKSNDLMNGVFNYYRKKSFPEDFTQKGYIRANCSTCHNSLTECLGKKSNDVSKMFHTDSISGSWVQIKMRYPIYITHYSLYQCNFDCDNKFYKWKLDGSNDGLTWYSLDDYSVNGNETMKQTDITYLYTVQHPGKYEFIKLITYRTTRPDGLTSHLVFSGFELFGTLNYEACITTKRSHSINILLFIYAFIHLT